MQASDERVHPRSAAQIDHGLPRLKRGEVEEVANPGEGLDGLPGNPVEVGDRIPESLCQSASHLEVELPARVLGHLAVHVLDLALQLFHVDGVHGRVPWLEAEGPCAGFDELVHRAGAGDDGALDEIVLRVAA